MNKAAGTKPMTFNGTTIEEFIQSHTNVELFSMVADYLEMAADIVETSGRRKRADVAAEILDLIPLEALMAQTILAQQMEAEQC